MILISVPSIGNSAACNFDYINSTCNFPLTEVHFFLQYPPCFKDMSFWLSDSFTENNLCEIVRGVAGDLVEEVS